MNVVVSTTNDTDASKIEVCFFHLIEVVKVRFGHFMIAGTQGSFYSVAIRKILCFFGAVDFTI